MTRTAKWLMFLILLVAVPVAVVSLWVVRQGGAATPHLSDVPTAIMPAAQPAGGLSAEDVIATILGALAHNDDPAKDTGIATAFHFASAENQRTTGPLGRFASMVKGPVYAPLIDHAAAEVVNMSAGPDSGMTFRVVVTIGSTFPVTEARGQRVAYLWLLSRQPVEGKGLCWVTDGVAIAPEQPDASPGEPTQPAHGS